MGTRKKAPQQNPWRLAFSVTMALVWAGASVIVSQLVVGNLMLWIIGAEALSQPVPTAIFSALSYLLAMVLVIIVPANSSFSWRVKFKKDGKVRQGKTQTSKIERDTLGLKGWPTWTDIGLAPVGFIVYLLLAAGLTAIFSSFSWFNATEVQEVGFSYYVSGFDRVVAFVTLVIVAPIAEEIIFRGWLYGRLREKIAAEYSNAISIVISSLLVSLLFGLVHMQWNVGVNVFALSLVLCGLREITGTIYAGILLHMLKNGVAFWMLYVIGIG
ncbi:CPBP family intramembrane metalloprotease [Candidatus Saccharibacteria bacterium]|nr:CPBP family intramembrane metalloprotease [Candidatus Saccharibacteria bacterium]